MNEQLNEPVEAVPVVGTFYRFAPVDDPVELQAAIREFAAGENLKGTVLIATEGMNGTLAGSDAALDALEQFFAADVRFCGMPVKRSTAASGARVFLRLKVLIKREIVTSGLALDPARSTGVHVDASRWNELLDDPAVRVIDTRNQYETAIGSFPGAEDPRTINFRDFADYVARDLATADRTQPIAMFCTGGIRCEKASSYLMAEGFQTVYQLDGGVLQYLETVPEGHNRWQGECFVFDQRVSVTAALEQGSFDQCHACRHPISEQDKASADFHPGVSCPHCIGRYDAEQRAGFAERARQVALAEQRGARHLGPQDVDQRSGVVDPPANDSTSCSGSTPSSGET